MSLKVLNVNLPIVNVEDMEIGQIGRLVDGVHKGKVVQMVNVSYATGKIKDKMLTELGAKGTWTSPEGFKVELLPEGTTFILE